MGEPRVFSEPSEITQVVDAFDEDDPFDLHLSLGYQHTWNKAQIRRESAIDQPGLTSGGYTEDTLKVADYSQTISRLNTRAEIGLFRDVALIVRVPIVLADDRKLSATGGTPQSVTLVGAPGEQLFQLPFTSPTRSGIEYLAVGVDAAVMNQFRDHTKPTWLIGIEGRFGVSAPMHACNKHPKPTNLGGGNQLDCAEPSDINRNGVGGEYQDENGNNLEGNFKGGKSPGVSRGTTGLELHTYISKRIKYVEPYAGFRALFEFPQSSSDFGITDFKGSLVNHPPLRGTMLVGTNVIPWEVRQSYQRIAMDFRFTGTYVSEGRDYSELFDALGSSDAPSLRSPLYSEYQANSDSTDTANPSVVKPSSEKVYFTGLTDVQPYGVYTLSTSVTWQAGEYVKFNVGGGYTLVQGHLISFDQPCNPDFSSDIGKSGPCRQLKSDGSYSSNGIPNPNYRAVINAPGRRFKVEDSYGFDVWLNATVMF